MPLDVSIRGSGPVAQVLALLLVRQGLRVGLSLPSSRPAAPQQPIQTSSSHSTSTGSSNPAGQDMRAYALNARSHALLHSLGVWPSEPESATARSETTTNTLASYNNAASPESTTTTNKEALLPFACEVQAMQVYDDAGQPIHFHQQYSEQNLAWVVEAKRLSQALSAAIAQVRQHARFGGNNQGSIVDLPGHASQASATQPPDATTLAQEAALTVICEGKDSALRDALGLTTPRTDYRHTAVVAQIRSTQAPPNTAFQFFGGPHPSADAHGPGSVLGLLPLQQGVFNLIWSLPQEEAQKQYQATEEAFTAALQAAIGKEGEAALGRLVLNSQRVLWPLSIGYAQHWVQPGVALAGDAAHTLHPLAGQGLNLGLADAQTLAETIGQRPYWQSPGDFQLLRRYERARKADVQSTLALTDGLHLAFACANPAWVKLRRLGWECFDKLPGLKPLAIRWAEGNFFGNCFAA